MIGYDLCGRMEEELKSPELRRPRACYFIGIWRELELFRTIARHNTDRKIMNHSQDLWRTQWVVGKATDESWERVNCASARIMSVKKERILYKRGGKFFTLETFFLFIQGPQIVSIYTVLNNGFNLGPFSWKCPVSPSHCCLSVFHSQVQTPSQPPLLLRLPVHHNAFENSHNASRINCFLPGEKKNPCF